MVAMGVWLNRRSIMRQAMAVVAGVAAATTTVEVTQAVDSRGPLPFYEGPAAAIHADRRTPPKHSQVDVVWSGDTAKRLVALTFDDGPMPRWTPKVLATLRRHNVPATFFLVGRNVVAHGDLLRDDLERHEFGNHTWEHKDLGRQDIAQAMAALTRTHEAITRVVGRPPVLMRPPYGHISGAALLASAELGYRMALWSCQMLESNFLANPRGLVDYIVSAVSPGDIVLAHDTGPRDRLVAIDNLDAMIEGLRGAGFEFVTVSQLLLASRDDPGRAENHRGVAP
jgi:peptidoglycan-N-acetylglucosamine deacetylase